MSVLDELLVLIEESRKAGCRWCRQPARKPCLPSCSMQQVLERVRESTQAVTEDLTGRKLGPFVVIGLERSGTRSPWWLLGCMACNTHTVRMGCHVRAALARKRGAICRACGSRTPKPHRKPKITERELVEKEAKRGKGC